MTTETTTGAALPASDGLVTVEARERTAILTLRRPDVGNLMNSAMLARMRAAIADGDASEDVDVIVLTGADPEFCVGDDIEEITSADPEVRRSINEGVFLSPLVWPPTAKPVIGAINGPAVTGGFELALVCDVLIASTAARFADTHARVGIMPGWGLSQRLSRAIGVSRAKELSLSGNYLDAATACEWGLVNRVVEPEDLMPAALKLAADMASIPAETLSLYKSIIDQGYGLTLEEGLALEQRRSSANNRQVTPEMVEARRAAIMARGRSQ